MIYEFESENQDDTMGMFDLMMTATKEVTGKDLNVVSFQKELSNTHFIVRTYSSLQEWVDEDNASEETGAKIFQKLSGVENIQEKYMECKKQQILKGFELQDYLNCCLNTVTWLQAYLANVK